MGKQLKRKGTEDQALVMRGSSKTYYSQTVSVPFESLKNPGFLPPALRTLAQPRANLPTFNTDRVAFTPAFKLPSDELDLEHYLQKHLAKKEQYEPIAEEQILMPRPKDKRYCHVCDSRFEDYQQHIDSDRHREVLREDRFQHRIERLCRKIAKAEHRPKTTRTTQSDREESFPVEAAKSERLEGPKSEKPEVPEVPELQHVPLPN